MKLGTIVKLPDGQKATVVFNGLVGVGVKWGEHSPDPADFVGTYGDVLAVSQPDDWPWEPDALIALPLAGDSRGTDDMIKQAKAKGLPFFVREISLLKPRAGFAKKTSNQILEIQCLVEDLKDVAFTAEQMDEKCKRIDRMLAALNLDIRDHLEGR
jgi:hypothetical protein